ncbi:hypothetical protein [Streptomyces formicae]|uniref:hypothetical protein n=1 Tax=Streptomyces formicae TaxID=1616117 RepID=UPI00131C39C3|nr:hypothetical protein [Streptomyces formicae]
MRGNNISVGPLTISNTRGGPGTLMVLIVLGLGILALAVYGGVRAIGVNDSPAGPDTTTSRQDTAGADHAPETSASGTEGPDSENPLADEQRRPILKDRAVVASVLPGVDAVPSGWTKESGPKIFKGSAAQCRPTPPDALFCGRVQYEAPATNNGFVFDVFPFSSVDAAKSAYQKAKQDNPPSMALPGIGDESHAFDKQKDSSHDVRAAVRVGSVVVGFTYRLDAEEWNRTYDSDHLEILTRMFTHRVQQALDGRTPTARTSL